MHLHYNPPKRKRVDTYLNNFTKPSYVPHCEVYRIGKYVYRASEMITQSRDFERKNQFWPCFDVGCVSHDRV